MIIFEILLLAFLIVCAISVSFIKRLTSTIIVFMSFSIVMSIIWMLLESPDLALTEAAVGAGISSVLFFLLIKRIHAMGGYPSSGTQGQKQTSSARTMYCVCSIIFVSVIIVAFLVALAEMPPFGDPSNPTNNEVYVRYVEQGMAETGAINIVAAVILDYRAFDTMGEAFILFTVMVFTTSLLKTSYALDIPEDSKKKEPVILRVIVMIIVPFLMVYGLYVLFNGHLSPGGGFSGGAVLGAGLSLYAAAFGVDKVRKIFSLNTYTICSGCALLFYALVKGYSFIMGANGNKPGFPLGTPGNLLSSGLILPLNVCVGVLVTFTMYDLFVLFSETEKQGESKWT